MSFGQLIILAFIVFLLFGDFTKLKKYIILIIKQITDYSRKKGS